MVKLIGSPTRWRHLKQLYHNAEASIYLFDIKDFLDGEYFLSQVENPQDRPCFSVLIKILTFFQRYRELEQCLYFHDPLPNCQGVFPQEITPVLPKGDLKFSQ